MNWWDEVEAPAQDLAKRLAARQGFGDQAMCLPYVQPAWVTYAREITLVELANLQPVWAQYVTAAREALAVRDEQAVDAVVGLRAVPDDGLLATFTDDPDTKWKREVGLGEDQE
jgi:hypothetical protein